MTVVASFVVLMTFLSTRADIIQDYARPRNTFFLVTREHIIHLYTPHNYFSLQETLVISRFDSVLYHWMGRIWTQSSPWLIIGPQHGLVHITFSMTLELSYFVTKIPKVSGKKKTRMSMCLTLGVTILSSRTEIELALSYQCTVFAQVWSAKVSMYLRIALFFLTALCMHLISPSVKSEAILFWSCI